MSEINKSKRSGNAVGNFNFKVEIISATGEAGPQLVLPVDAVRGLGDAKTNVIRYRSGGLANVTSRPYPGLSPNPPPCTIEGTYLFDLGDIKELAAWRDQVKGKVLSDGISYFRDIMVVPDSADFDSLGVAVPEIVGTSIILRNCICVALNLADFDINSPAVSSWSMEIEYEEMEIK
jgi:hypothetical protein